MPTGVFLSYIMKPNMKATIIAPIATITRPRLKYAKIKAAIVAITETKTLPVDSKIAGKVSAAKTV